MAGKDLVWAAQRIKEKEKAAKPVICWYCREQLEEQVPFFCGLECGYQWALREANALHTSMTQRRK